VHALPIDAEVRPLERHANHAPARQFDRGLVRVIRGLEQDDFIARPHHGVNRTEKGLGSTGSDGHLRLRHDASLVERFDLLSDRLQQRWPPRHRRVLVHALAHLLRHEFHQPLRRIEIRKSLRQIDRAALLRKPRHDREDRRADARQLG
jgi:hypothetical protein